MFTAYLRSNLLEEMDEVGTIDMDEFTELRKLLDITKDQMRRHFLQRDAEKASGIVDTWREQNIYPYEGQPRDVMEDRTADLRRRCIESRFVRFRV